MIWEFFNRRICLTTLPDEWALAEQEFARVGLEVERFQSLPDIGPHQSFSKSEREILLRFWLEEDPQTLLHLEDDCTFREFSHLEPALPELPSDWDILYLGANLLCWNRPEDPKPERFSDHLFRVRQAWTTHAIVYNRKCIYELLAKQPALSETMWDQYLSSRLPEFNAYVIAPMIAYQRPRKSSIWLKEEVDDYTGIFEASEELLR